MDPKFKTYLLIGALAALVVGAAGYGLYREYRKPAPMAPAPVGARQDEASSLPQTDGLRIETVSSVVGGTAGNTARVVGKPGLRYEWEIKGGELELGRDRDAVQWSAGLSGEVILTCRGFDPSGPVLVATQRVSITALPRIADFTVVPAVITQGEAARLGWNVRDFSRMMLDPGGRDVTTLSGPGLEVKPTETTVYVLTATDRNGQVATGEVTLKVVPPPQITVLRAEAKPGTSDAFTVIGEFRGAKAELKSGSEVVARADSSPLRADLSGLKAGSIVTMSVSNEAGMTVTGTMPFALKKP